MSHGIWIWSMHYVLRCGFVPISFKHALQGYFTHWGIRAMAAMPVKQSWKIWENTILIRPKSSRCWFIWNSVPQPMMTRILNITLLTKASFTIIFNQRIYCLLWDVINHAYHNFNGGLSKPSFEWLITMHTITSTAVCLNRRSND